MRLEVTPALPGFTPPHVRALLYVTTDPDGSGVVGWWLEDAVTLRPLGGGALPSVREDDLRIAAKAVLDALLDAQSMLQERSPFGGP